MFFFKEGDIVDGLFKITRPYFKRGAAGELHLASGPRGEPVVLKFPTAGGITRDVNQFKREYKILLKFSHPNVARAFHFGEVEGRFFIAFEFVEGEEFQKGVRGLKPSQMVPLFIQALEGLEAIHSLHMLHLDIKSSNILVTPDQRVKIIDFGLTMAMGELDPNRVCGTAYYIAPEMILKQGVDNRADLFSAGVLFYYCLTGAYPHPDRHRIRREILLLQKMVGAEEPPLAPSACNSFAEPYLDKIILNLLAKSPQERFGSARAVINALKTHHPEDYRETPEAKGSYLIPEGKRHIGREREQTQIRECLRELGNKIQPASAVFYLRGDPGMGKSHLLRRIKEEAEVEAEKFSIHFLELPKELSKPAEGNEEWLGEWISFFNQRLLENKKPLLLLLDNAELAPPPLEALLENLFKLLLKRISTPNLFQDQMPLLLCLASQKPWEETSFPEIYPWPVRIELKPFTLEDVREYLSRTPALKNKPLPEAWLRTLYLKTQGNPSELKERLREQDSKGLLFDLNGEILMAHVEDSSVEVTDDESIPKSTRERLSKIIGKLTQEEEKILERIAVMTWKGFVPGAAIEDLQEVMGRNHLLPILNALVSKGILVHDGKKGIYAFPRNSSLAPLVYQGLDEKERAGLHQIFGRRLRGDAALFHTACGEDRKGVLKAALKLSSRMLGEEGKPKFAKMLLERALVFAGEGSPKAFVFFASRLVEACCYSGAYEQALDCYEKAKVAAGDRISSTLRSLLTISVLPCFIDQQKFDLAGGLTDEALALFPARGSSWCELLLRNFWGRIFYKMFFSEKGRGEELLRQAKEVYEANEKLESALDKRQRMLIRNNDLGSVLKSMGFYDAAIGLLEKKYSRLKGNRNVFIEFGVLTDLAESHRLKNEYAPALRYAALALKEAQKTGQGKWILHAHHILAGIHQARGMLMATQGKGRESKRELEEALAENTRCLAASVCLEDRRSAAFHLQGIFIRKGQCYEELKKWEMAMTHFKAALDYQPSDVFLAIATLGLGECYVQSGDLGKARGYLEQSRQTLKNLPNPVANHCHFKILMAEGRCFLREKDRKGLDDCLKRMRSVVGNDDVLALEYKRFEGECSDSESSDGGT